MNEHMIDYRKAITISFSKPDTFWFYRQALKVFYTSKMQLQIENGLQ